jgi:hypothetical protein
MRNIFALIVLALVGCSTPEIHPDHQKLRELESELVLSRNAYAGFAAAVRRQINYDDELKTLINKADQHLCRSIDLTHQLTGDE